MNAYIRRSVEALSGYVPGEQPRDRGLVKLNTNENPYPPSPRVREAIEAFSADTLRLYPDPVSSGLRGRIAEIHETNPSSVFVGNGSDEVLALCTRAFVENDGSIGYFEPSYSLYPVLAAIRDVSTAPVALAEDFAWAMPANYRASLFFLTCPNAPTGMVYDKQVVRSFCKSFPGIVVLDEAYVDFADDHCGELALELDNVLVLRTLSKSFSLAGIRLGYAIGNEPLVEALNRLKDSYNIDALSQVIALAALSDLDHMKSGADRIRATRTRLVRALVERGFQVSPSQANFVWARPGSQPAEALFVRLRERKILVRYFPGERTGNHVRITVGTDDQVDRLLAELDGIITDA